MARWRAQDRAMTDLDTPEQQAYRDGYAQGKADAEKRDALHEALVEYFEQLRIYGDDISDHDETRVALERVREMLK